MLFVSTKHFTGGPSDTESDDDSNLGGLKPVHRFQRSTTPSNSVPNRVSKRLSFLHLKANSTDGLGDFQDLISFLREQGAFPNRPPTGGSQSTALVKYKHSSSPSNTSYTTTTSLFSAAAYSTPPSSPEDQPNGTTRYVQRYKGKEVRWTESVGNGSGSEDEVVKQRPVAPSYGLHGTMFDDPGFLPSSIVPPQPSPQPYLDPADIHPKYTLTLVEKQMKLVKKLLEKFSNEPGMVGDPVRIGDLASNKSNNGIHVFVDLSNILIGFANQLKADRKIPNSSYRRQPPIAFHSLAMVLERGRQVARRVLAGSTPANSNHSSTTPSYLLEAQACGYEVNILERVRKLKPAKYKHGYQKKGASSGSGYATGGNSSASDSATVLTNAEQGVDEILHLKMSESMLDTLEPSTMVLASGDAAPAEYSEGFLAMVLRALKRGWKVEVIAWKSGLSHYYRDPGFLKSWENQFKVILLDDYCEEMLAIYAEKFVNMDTNSYDRFV